MRTYFKTQLSSWITTEASHRATLPAPGQIAVEGTGGGVHELFRDRVRVGPADLGVLTRLMVLGFAGPLMGSAPRRSSWTNAWVTSTAQFRRATHVTPGMRKRLMPGLTEQWEAALDTRLAMCPASPLRVLDHLLRARSTR